jgi:hypothetical protein
MIKVMSIVSSIDPQLDASGVITQGDKKWNKTDPMTIRINAMAMPIPAPYILFNSVK